MKTRSTKFMTMTWMAVVTALIFAQTVFAGAPPAPYFNGFETDISGWDVSTNNPVRVMSGTEGITASTGDWYAKTTAANTSPFTRWGGYSSNFPSGGYSTLIDIYLDVNGGFTNDTRFDFSSAINNSSGTHLRDFVFNAGFYNDDTGPGAGSNRFVISASNNAGRGSSYPKNPGRDPISITQSGWYTFKHTFRDNGSGVLAVDLIILDASETVIKTWTLSDPTDIIGSTVGGNRYGWFAANEFAFLAFDNSERTGVEPCASVCYVDANSGNDANGGGSIADAKKTIQAAIDAVDPGGEVRVLPGNYSETATNRSVLGTSGPYQLGLFIAKDGVTIQGVDASDLPLTDYNALGAYVTTNATNNFGYSGIFVEGDNVTIAGLHIGPNTPGDNKTIEIIGDGFTLKDSHVDVPGGGSVYFNDWQFDTASNTSHVQSYTINHNLIDQSTSIDITSGAGLSGDVIGRQITNNEFVNADYWPSISFNGSGTGVPWFVQSVGGAVIKNNSFTNTFNGSDASAAHIRVRGVVDNNQFGWASYWTDNTYNKAVVTLEGVYPPFNVRQYNYVSGTYSFAARRIGVNIQSSVDKAQPGDTVLVKEGTYVEQVAVGKSLTLLGESGADVTLIKAPSTIPVASNAESNIVKIAGAGVSVELSGFTVAGPGPSGCGSIGTGILVRDDAYANIHDNKILDIRDNPFSGCQNGVAIQVGRASLGTNGTADITDNIMSGYQKNGVTVSNSGSSAIVENNIITGKGATTVIAQNGIQFSGGATGSVNGNTISGHSYSPGSYTSTGMLLYGADVDTFANALSENQVGVYHIEGSGVHEANILNVSSAGTQSPYFYGFVVDAPPPGLNPEPFEDGVAAPALMTTFSVMSAPIQDVDLLNNELMGDGSSAGIGIGGYSGFGNMDIDLTVKNNKITDFGIGVDIYHCVGYSYCTTNQFSNIDVNLNSITGNADYGLINTDAPLVDAELNWWSSADGPQPTGGGDIVSGDVDYTPWLCVDEDTSTDTGYQPLVKTDCAGPLTTSVAASPNPVIINGSVTVTANVDDSITGGSTIASAEYSLDGGTSWMAMAASDGAFDEVGEDVKALFNAPSLPGIYNYNLCVRGTDAQGNTGSKTCLELMLVVYDPSGGFVTGGGWIDSPVNTNYQYMGVAGKATFGFVSKYKKGATVPEGNTEFQFKAGNLTFQSTSYQWLVVNQGGTNAQFKGYGSINGQGNYDFMLWATDGTPDKFRIQIWDAATEVVFYDNGNDQPIGGGSIVVHKK